MQLKRGSATTRHAMLANVWYVSRGMGAKNKQTAKVTFKGIGNGAIR